MENKEFCIGVYGDGQLARLLAVKAIEWNQKVVILTTNREQSPCHDIAHKLIEADTFHDHRAFRELVSSCSMIFLENEFVPPEFLNELEAENFPCFPNAKSYTALSDKWKQSLVAETADVKIPRTVLVQNADELNPPLMLKAIRGGYDGYGNFTFTNESQRNDANNFILKNKNVIAQEMIDFDIEVAVMAIRYLNKKTNEYECVTFPVVETIQEKNICHMVISPPRLPKRVQDKIKSDAIKLIEEVDGIGLFGVEFFIKGEEVIFNEIAPRPHNSAHLTIEGMYLSQFEALLRIGLGLPMIAPEAKYPYAGMLNLLGTQNGPCKFIGVDQFYTEKQGAIHLYGKKDSKIGRKMGHYTLVDESLDEVLNKLMFLKTRYQI